MPNLPSIYSDYAAEYEYKAGGVTREMSAACLSSVPPLTPDSVVHDNACGPGIVTSVLMESGAKPTIYATDLADGMVEVTNGLAKQNGWRTVHGKVMDGQNLEFSENYFTHSFSCMGIYLFPNPTKGVEEMYRTLRPGGTACVTGMRDIIWAGYAEKVYAERFPDAQEPLGIPDYFVWSKEGVLANVLAGAGFRDISVKEINPAFRFEDAETTRTIWKSKLKTFSTALGKLDDATYDAYYTQFWDELAKDHVHVEDNGRTFMKVRVWLATATK